MPMPANDNDDVHAELESIKADCEAFAQRLIRRITKLQARQMHQPSSPRAEPRPEDYASAMRALRKHKR